MTDYPIYRILLVDDDADDRLIVREDLESIDSWRIDLREASSLAGASALLCERDFDVALVDFRLGAGTALDFIRDPEVRRRNLPVVVLTGRNDRAADLAAMEAGAADFLPKEALSPPLLERSLRYSIEEARRHRIEARFRALIENSRDPITVLGPDGSIQYSSPALEQTLGYAVGGTLGANALGEVHPEDRERVEETFQRLVAEKGAVAHIQYRVAHADGSWRIFDTIAQNMLAEPMISGIVVNSRDVTELRRAEADLVETSRLLRQVMESLEESILVVDLSTGRIRQCNAAVSEMFGYSAEELVGKPAADIYVSKEERDKFIEGAYPTLRSGHVFKAEWRMRRRDGSVFPTDHMISLLEPSRGLEGGIVHVIRDRTDRVKQEQQVRFQAELLDRVAQPVIAVDDDGSVTYWNPAVAELTGYAAEEVLGRSVRDLVVVREDVHLAAEAEKSVNRGENWRGEIRIRTRGGDERIMLATDRTGVRPDGSIGGRIATGIDVTELRRAERARESAMKQVEFQAHLLGAVGQAVIATDAQGRVTYWNRAAEELYGWSADEAMGQLISDLTPAETSREQAESILRALQEGATWSGDFEVRRKSGEKFIASVMDAPLLDERGKLIGMIGISHDVTESRQLADQLRQAQKMEAIGRLAGGVAHDFNNLLTAIKGHAGLLLEELDPASEAADDARHILSSADRAATLTRQLLAFSRKQVLESRKIDLSAAVTDLEPMLQRLIPERIELSIENRAPDPIVYADPTQLHQVIMNLVVNAVDAIRDNGRIELTLEEYEMTEARAAEFPWQAKTGRYVCLTVKDSGHGMSPEVSRQIFEPFFTTKPEGQGTGLGLATVYGIVKQSGGHILVDSEPGAGTTFRVLLPLTDGTPESLQPAREGRGAKVSGSGKVVLLVEDDDAVRGLARRVLEQNGFDVLVAANGRQALELVKGVKKLDLVLSDVVMPEMGGPELAVQVRRKWPTLPVVLMSGYSEADLRGEVREHGDAFLTKPFTPSSLLSVLATVGDGGTAS
jgi:two-component system, cell cycle sensor histidine kinase and response regulator CckA